MEPTIGELERLIRDNCSLLESMAAETQRRRPELGRPEGHSAPRNSHPLLSPRPEGIPGAAPQLPGRTAAKLQHYTGATQLEPYLAQVTLAATHNGWGQEETATHLALALEGPALQVLLDLPLEEQRDLRALTTALGRRFGQRPPAEQSREELARRRRREGESLGSFAADVRLYARRGYPTFPGAAREELGLHAFLRGLTPERLRQHVRLSSPRDLEEALREAERAEEVLRGEPVTRRSARGVEREMSATQSDEEEEARRAQPEAVPRRRRRTDCCYRCGEPGHLARNCPAPSPRARVTSPTGNGHGAGQ